MLRTTFLAVLCLVTAAPSFAATRNDFDGDGKADILWNHRGGSGDPGLGLVHRMSLAGLSIVSDESA